MVFKYENILSSDEKNKASRFKFENDRIIYSTSRGILRLLLSDYLEINSKEIEFGYTKFGKPFFKTDLDLKFNVSHSGERIVIAFCKGQEIGIDIEKIKNHFEVMSLAQNFFSKQEFKALELMPKNEQQRSFYRCWTRKEAFVKAQGRGLSFPFDKFTVSLDQDTHAELLQTNWNAAEKDNWDLFSFIPEVNYLGALAVRAKFLNLSYFNWAHSKV